MSYLEKKYKNSKELTPEDLIKEALIGPMGDGIKEMFAQTIYERVKDQADRFGLFPPAWPMFIDALRNLPFIGKIYQNPSTPEKYGQDLIVEIKPIDTPARVRKELFRLKNGALCLAHEPVDNKCYKVLAQWEKSTGMEYVTWIADQEGSCFWGHYFNDYIEALKDYRARS